MFYCSNCGKQNPNTAKFCTGCGAILTNTKYSETPKNNYKVIILVSVFLITIVASYFIFFNPKNKPATITVVNADTAAVLKAEPFIPKNSYTINEQFYYNLNKDKIVKWATERRFFPIGWSRDGKFAWIEENNSDAVNEYFFDLYIQDLVTDKILWHWNFTVSDEDNSNEDQKAGFNAVDDNDVNRRKIWTRYSELNVMKLNEYQIEPVIVTNLEKFPLNINGGTSNVLIKNQTLNNSISSRSEILATSVNLTVNGNEKKRIFINKYATGQSEWDGHLSNQIPGFLKSPFENRIALFLLDEYNAWETSSEWTFTIIGCDLNNVSL